MRIHGSLSFSRSDRRENGANLSRIDRFYVSNYVRLIGGQIGIMAGTTFSDHAPVTLILSSGRNTFVNTARMIDSVVRDKSSREEVT